MKEQGKLYKTNGKVEDVFPHDGKKFTLAELQRFVGGNIEHVPRSKPFAYCNEEGTLNGLPVNNEASLAFDSVRICGQLLCGDVIQVYKVPWNSVEGASGPSQPETERKVTTKIWTCKIGERPIAEFENFPRGSDSPMRRSAREAYQAITGHEPDFIFSGWGGELTEGERAAVENRELRRSLEPSPASLSAIPEFDKAVMRQYLRDAPLEPSPASLSAIVEEWCDKWGFNYTLPMLEELEAAIALIAAKPVEPSTDALYAAYANHCAIQSKVPLTAKSWERERCPKHNAMSCPECGDRKENTR